ncbi:MAG: Vitamin B12 transporter BtuB [Haliscomenobacter sp.]|jgi:outer membrane receptor for ferrienterochelin and colicins|nr:Vitamin B12 transporter BtuB [Haliscomenobacter sp.]
MKPAISLIALLLLFTGGLYAQSGVVRGVVRDADTREPLAGANILVAGTTNGTASDADGAYRLEAPAGQQTITVSFVGYADFSQTITVRAGAETELNLMLSAEGLLGQEVVVSASRKAEKLTNAPATISVINARAITEFPSFNVAELLGRQRGVDYVRSGVLGIGINARGFNSAFNPKNLQINDARLSSLVATGLPLGALSTTVKEDVERIEVILGPSSALYGPNAHNGLLNTITKDPRTSQGTTAALGIGNQNVLSARLRHAMKVSDKLAFKVSGEYTKGTEFEYTDTVYSGALKFPEYDLDLDFNSLRGEAGVYYALSDNTDLILAGGASNSNNIGNTNAGRNQIRDWRVSWLQLRLVSPRFFAQVYHTWSKTDSTYAMNRRTLNYWSFKNAGFSQSESERRSFSEFWFPLSSTTGLALNRGALFQDQSKRLNAEAQYNNKIGGISYIVGVQYQNDRANSNGTYLLDKNAQGVVEDIVIGQIGGYLQLESQFSNHLRAVVAARADNHDVYGFNFIPKAALIYFNDKGSFRVTYGQGIAAPTILNLEANIFGGLLLGNGAGFTVKEVNTSTNQIVNTYEVKPLEVEKISTVEFGYKGQISPKLFFDANAYYNWSKNFLSPSIDIAPDRDFYDHDNNPATAVIPRIKGYATLRGDQAMSEITTTAALPDGSKGTDLVLTYVNFGDVNTYGFDASVNYAITPALLGTLNYSYFGYDIDTADPANDGNRDTKVNESDLPINTPTHKIGVGLNYSSKKFFATAFGRWVNAYDFFSGINVSAATNTSLIYGGSPVVENQRVGTSFNYGPLGGFFNLDLGAGYRFSDWLTLSGQVVNALNQEVREFVGSPAIKPLFSLEVKVNLPAIGKK